MHCSLYSACINEPWPCLVLSACWEDARVEQPELGVNGQQKVKYTYNITRGWWWLWRKYWVRVMEGVCFLAKLSKYISCSSHWFCLKPRTVWRKGKKKVNQTFYKVSHPTDRWLVSLCTGKPNCLYSSQGSVARQEVNVKEVGFKCESTNIPVIPELQYQSFR